MKEYLVVIMIMSVALAMDAFAVAITLGMDGLAHTVRDRLKVSISFGFFQGLLFVIGIVSLKFVSGEITTYNHLIAGVILIILGVRMLKEAFESSKEEYIESHEMGFNKKKGLSLKLLAMFGIATSIDALAVGVTFAFLNVSIMEACLIIGCTTFVLSVIGVVVGNFFGTRYKRKAEIAGGVILILIGLKILLEHLGIIAF